MTDDREHAVGVLSRQAQNGAGYSEEERATLSKAAEILRKKVSRGGPQSSGGPVDDTLTR